MDRELLVAHPGGNLLPKRVLFLETKGKEAVKTFFYKCSNSGIYESTPQPITGNKVVAFPEIPLPKKALQKNRSIFGLKNQSCYRR